MAVIKPTIQAAIRQLLTDMRSKNDETEALDYYSQELAGIIADAILSADVNPGIPVATTGTSVDQTGSTTGPGSLS